MEDIDIYDELEKVIGPDATKNLVAHYAGSNLYIPKNISVKRKHQQIREAFGNGASYRVLSRLYGLSERHVRRIVHKKRPKGSSNNP